MKDNLNLFKNLKHDFPASIVVFLVALPLCLGIALASGAPLFSGVIAGVIGGILVGALSGSALGVSGPAAGLAVIVLVSIEQLGSFEAFLLTVVIAGVIQVALGFMKAGIIGYYFPSSVIKGMLAGIGIIIILKQIPHAVGYDSDFEGDMSMVQPDGHTTFSQLYYMFDYISVGAVIISLTAMAILLIWETSFIKRQKSLQYVQGPLVAVVSGIVLTWVFSSIPDLALNPNQIVSLPVAESIPAFFGQFTFPDFSRLLDQNIYIIGITMAIVASLETLLCVEATDKLDPSKRVTPTNRELKAQGVGNILSGLIGGLPITQVIVRSSANIQSGGKTKMSAILHGILMLICVVSIPNILNLIPLASLATVLIVVGYKLAKPTLFKQMYQRGWYQFVPFMVTIIGIVLTDLLTGIGLGMVVGVFLILYDNYKTPYFYHPEKQKEGEPIRIELSEHVSFLNKASILQTLNKLPNNPEVVIDMSESVSIDDDVLDIIRDFKVSAVDKNIKVRVKESVQQDATDPVRTFKQSVNGMNQNTLDENAAKEAKK